MVARAKPIENSTCWPGICQEELSCSKSDGEQGIQPLQIASYKLPRLAGLHNDHQCQYPTRQAATSQAGLGCSNSDGIQWLLIAVKSFEERQACLTTSVANSAASQAGMQGKTT